VQNNLGYLITVKGKRVRVGGGSSNGPTGEIVEEDWGSSFTGQALESFDPSTQETVDGQKKTILGSGTVTIKGIASAGQKVDLTYYPFSYTITVQRPNTAEVPLFTSDQITSPIVHNTLCTWNTDELNQDGSRKFPAGDYTVKLTVTPGNQGGAGGTVTTVVTLITFDVDVDADNTTLEGYPDTTKGDRGPSEEAAEDTSAVRTFANIHDINNNGVPGYADGIDKFGNGQANACWKFEPMVIEVPSPAAVPNARYIFKYSASNPEQMTREEGAGGYFYHLPTGKILRIWKKDGDEVRNPQSAHLGGDFILEDQAYTAQQLGWTQGTTIRLYIEAANGEGIGQETAIELDCYPRGTDHPETVMSETVKVLPYYMSSENPTIEG
jgi:hypothetical protein